MDAEIRQEPRRPAAPPAAIDHGPGSTAAVLWLMIMLIFVPIVGMHLAVVWVNGGEGDPPAAADGPIAK